MRNTLPTNKLPNCHRINLMTAYKLYYTYKKIFVLDKRFPVQNAISLISMSFMAERFLIKQYKLNKIKWK